MNEKLKDILVTIGIVFLFVLGALIGQVPFWGTHY